MSIKYLIFGIMLIFLGFFIAATGASLFLIRGEGFSAAAEVFFYGLAGSAAGLVAAILLSRRLPEDKFRKVFGVVLALTLIAICAIAYRVVTMQKKYTAESISGQDIPVWFAAFAEDGLPAGMGLAKPHLSGNTTLFLYGPLPVSSGEYPPGLVDSIVIKSGAYHFEIISAPPWYLMNTIGN